MIVIISELASYRELLDELNKLDREYNFTVEKMAKYPEYIEFQEDIVRIERLKLEKQRRMEALKTAIIQAAKEVQGKNSKQIAMLNKKNIILWWILMVILIFIISAIKLYGQTSVNICSPVSPINFSPAPCSIEGASVERPKFLIQVGVYRNRITPQPHTMCLQVGDLYYYYISKFYDNREQAQQELTRLHEMIDRSTGKPIYCDAIIVPSPLKDLSFFE